MWNTASLVVRNRRKFRHQGGIFFLGRARRGQHRVTLLCWDFCAGLLLRRLWRRQTQVCVGRSLGSWSARSSACCCSRQYFTTRLIFDTAQPHIRNKRHTGYLTSWFVHVLIEALPTVGSSVLALSFAQSVGHPYKPPFGNDPPKPSGHENACCARRGWFPCFA